jgi:hypothetical protein
MNNQIIPGSIGAVAQQNGKSIAESFANADVIIIVDTSGSMEAHDSRGGKSRYDVACEELKNLQASLPGKLALLSFSSDVLFCPNGIPFDFGGMTDLAKALKFAKMADVTGMRFIVISDGEPDSEQDALDVAKTYKNRIDTIYVGSEHGAGQEFLKRLAKASGGQGVTSAQVKELASDIKQLLLA